MFKREDGSAEIETIIGPSVQVEGDFIAAGDVVVEGTVAGKLETQRNLRVGEGAKIFANISAANALIAGEVQGNIKASESLELTNTAKVFGDIKTKTITVAAGAIVQGRCQAGEERRSKLEKIEDKAKTKAKENKEKLLEIPVK